VFACLGVQVAGATWRAAAKNVAGVGDLVQMTGDGCTDRVLGGRMIGRSSDAACGLHRARGDEKHGFIS
jgi:CobQ-like glutamine amidotransferase family enzyme